MRCYYNWCKLISKNHSEGVPQTSDVRLSSSYGLYRHPEQLTHILKIFPHFFAANKLKFYFLLFTLINNELILCKESKYFKPKLFVLVYYFIFLIP